MDRSVTVALADAFCVFQIEEQGRFVLVRLRTVHDGSLRMVPVAFNQDAAAALTGVKIAEEGLVPDAVRAAPERVLVELAIGRGFQAAEMRTVDW